MKFLQSQRGMALLTVLLAISTIALYTSMGLSRSTTENQAADFSVLTQQAFQLAEAGLDEAIWNFRQLPTPPQDVNPHDPFTGLPCGSPGTERPLGSGRYSVCVDPDDNNPNPGLSTDYFDVTVTATVDGTNARRTIGAMLRSSSFTRFAVFQNQDMTEDGLLPYWTSAITVNGPLHSNAQLHLFGNPNLTGVVSSAAAALDCPWGCTPPAQLQLNAANIPLPASLNWTLQHADLVLSGQTTISVSGSTMTIDNAGSIFTISVSDYPVVFVTGGQLTVQGVQLDGQLTLACDDDVTLTANIVYSCDPQNAACQASDDNDDILGIASEGDIIVGSAAPNDLLIQAALFSTGGSFKVEGFSAATSPPLKGNLTTYGAVIRNWSGITGKLDAVTGTLMAGYSTTYLYDARLLDTPPPFFPMTSWYDVVHWREQ